MTEPATERARVLRSGEATGSDQPIARSSLLEETPDGLIVAGRRPSRA